ncbi:MAG: cytochrome-c oxidase, cbb3-type subunit I, partial [Cereibacter sp.]
MWDYLKLVVLAVVTVGAAIAANYAHDLPYMVNAVVVMLAAAITFIWTLRHVGDPPSLADVSANYNDGVVKAGV